MDNKFNKLALNKELLKNLKELKYHEMTPIQALSLPVILDGKDIIAMAKTGSGKTAAFGLGILNKIHVPNFGVQALILCPTRELASQVAEELRRLARMTKNLKVLTISGGTSEYHQEKSLSHGAHIIVGTPGRVLRLLRKKTLNISQVNSFVLDEADRMLDMGFIDDITKINFYLDEIDHQAMLFSATFPEEIVDLSRDILNEPVEVKVDIEHEEASIEEIVYELESHKEKNKALLKVLGDIQPERAIIFCKTKKTSDDVSSFLQDKGIASLSIHGDLEQNERTATLAMFSNNSLSILVATDVAARGIDIKELPLVVNYDITDDPEVYTHRIGRTGRAGNQGVAVTFSVSYEVQKLERIEDSKKKSFKVIKLEDFDHVEYLVRPKMQTIYIAGGKKDKLRPGDILGAIVGETKLGADIVGDISISNIVSFIAIKKEHAELVVSKLQNGKIKNRKFRVGFA